MTNTVQKIILEELLLFIKPLVETEGTLEGVKEFLMEIGWDIENIMNINDQLSLSNHIKEIIEIATSIYDPPPSDIPSLLIWLADNAVPIFKNIQALSETFPKGLPEDVLEMPVDILQSLTLKYIQSKSAYAIVLLELIGLLNKSQEVVLFNNGKMYRIKNVLPSIRFDQIDKFIKSPKQVFNSKYWPASFEDEGRGSIDLAFLLYKLIHSMGLFHRDRDADIPDVNDEGNLIINHKNKLRFYKELLGDEYDVVQIGVIFKLSNDSDAESPIIITPFGKWKVSRNFHKFIVNLDGNIEDTSVVITSSGIEPQFSSPLQTVSYARLSLKTHQEDEGAIFLFGDKASTYLQLGEFGIYFFLILSKETFEIGIGLELEKFVINITGGNGFLKSVLPPEGIRNESNLVIEWTNKRGLIFQGGGLEILLPIHISLGPVDVLSLTIGLKPKDGEIPIEISSSVQGTLGPITFVIENIGLEAGLTFPKGGGNLGPIDFQLGFLPPSGVGLSVNSSGITGGGFLDFDRNNQRYTGVLGLQFGNIGLTAIGLIVTKFPDGSDNFALLINIGVTFTPGIQLGFGFFLSGVGGLIAVNRSMSVEALQKGIREGAVSNLLFPDVSTVVANADQLITQYEGIFPVQDGRYVIAPMIQVGWGPMNMISGEVGIFIEIPMPVRVALLGQVKVRFPSYDASLVVINLDLLGVIDFDKSELTFQASLIDSRILEFPISGDSAFLLGWGGSPRFALSMGGFHPKYNPPPPAAVFADMKRLKISIGSGDGLDISCESYMALTSNSLQFGADVQVKASAGPLEVYGYLGFDGLFIFSPFSFEVEIRGGVDLSYDGTSLCGVHLYLLLSGPTPWYARGTATIEILFFSFDVGFEFSWGDEDKEVLPAKDPLELLLEELKQPENWGAAQLNRYSLVESFREADPNSPDKPELLLHPASQLEIRQRVVPLAPQEDEHEIRITKFGYAPVTGHDWFDISGFVINNTALGGDAIEDIDDYFAKAQFFDVTKDAQLSLPAFNLEKAGLRVSAEAEVLVSASCSKKDVEYEVILLDEYGLHQGTSTQKVDWPKLEGKVSGYADKHQYYRQTPDFRYKSKSLMQPVKRVKRQEGYVIVKKNEKGQWIGPVAMADIHKTYKCLPVSLSNRKETTYSKGECLEMLQSIRRSTLKRINNLRIVEAWAWNKSQIN